MKHCHLIALALVAATAGCDGDSGATDPGADTAIVTPSDTSVADTSAPPSDTVAPVDTGSTAADTLGDNGDPVPDVPTGLTVPLDELCAPLAESACQIFVGCRAGVGADSVAACRTHAAATCEASLTATRPRVAAGAITYDARAAHDCILGVGLIGCGELDGMLGQVSDVCADVFGGTLADGSACAHAGDCADGLYCAPDAGGACPGTCRPEAQAGQACDSLNTPCASGSFCELGVCVADQVALSAECVITEQCPAGAFCDDTEDTARCHIMRDADGICGDDDACGAGLFCSTVDFADAGVCLAKLAADAPCTPFISGAQCSGGQACDMETEVCVDAPTQVGDPCVEDWQPCGAAGLWCDFSDTTCRAEPRIGDDCGSGGAMSCQYGFCSAADAQDTGTCLDYTAPGAACTGDRECGGLSCVAGACAPPSDLACHPTRRGLLLGPGFRLF